MAGAGCEQTSSSAEERRIASGGGANGSAVPDGSLDVLARAVVLVAGMAIPEHDRAAFLSRVIATMVAGDEELFMPFELFLWFKAATIEQLSAVERPPADHLYWRPPACFPLVANQDP